MANGPQKSIYKPGEVLVQFNSDAGETTVSAAFKSMKVSVAKTLLTASQKGAGGSVYRVTIPKGMSVPEAVDILRADSSVLAADPNYFLRAIEASSSVIPNDPYFRYQWGLNAIHAPEAWDILREIPEGQDVVVAVIDTGIQVTHSDLKTNFISGWDCINEDPTVWDRQDYTDKHGTHTSGTVGAIGNNGLGVAGVAWKVQIMPIKFMVFGSGTSADAIEALYWAYNHGALISSNSWGRWGDPSDVERLAFEETGSPRGLKPGMLHVCAAGNDGKNTDTGYPLSTNYPSAYCKALPNIISVAASVQRGGLASFSNWGPGTVHIAAPGDAIWSTVPTNSYQSFSGTSMATPHVAGAAALVAAKNPSAHTFDGVNSVKAILLNSVDQSSLYSEKVSSRGHLNLYRALSNNLNEPPNIVVFPGSLRLNGSQTVPLTIQNTGLGDLIFSAGIRQSQSQVLYLSKDSTMPGGPAFEWVEISKLRGVKKVSLGDDASWKQTLPFVFPFYGETFSKAYISSNGFITFGSAGATYYDNDPIPSAEPPNGFIAPFWDDLNPRAGGAVYYFYDAANKRIIVQWNQIPHYRRIGVYTFQAILCDDGTIIYQYKTMKKNVESGLSQATVGVESPDGEDGLQLAYNTQYVSDGLAVKFARALAISPASGTISPSGSVNLMVSANASLGSFSSEITIDSNDPDTPSVPINVEVLP